MVVVSMCPTLMRGRHDGSFFGMFGSDTNAMGRFYGCCMLRINLLSTCYPLSAILEEQDGLVGQSCE